VIARGRMYDRPMEHDDTISLKDTADDTIELEEELLVEEISIDGMCGVY
jgi:mycofactocin precursor